MARRIQLLLADSASATDANGFDWPGGDGLLMVDATWGGGSVKLEQLSPKGVWLGINAYATATPISLTANGTAHFRAPAGKIRVNITTATNVNAHAVGIPGNIAG